MSGAGTSPAAAAFADEPAIVVRGLRKAYGERRVLEDLSLTVHRGELVALLGPNGAGKTTTVEILEGYRSRDGGEVAVLGMDPAREPRALRGRLGLMLQDGGVHPRTSPREALRLVAALHRSPADPDALLRLLDLERVATTASRRLSGGERQRLGLALALVGRPEILALDEPTAGLDPEARADVRELIAALRDAGMAILLTTHDLGDVERLADRVAVLAGGRTLAEGSPRELAGGDTRVVRFRLEAALDDHLRVGLEAALDDHPRTLVEAGGTRSPGVARVVAESPGGRYRIDGVSSSPALVAALASWCAEHGHDIVELRTGDASLEERYLELLASVAAQDAGA